MGISVFGSKKEGKGREKESWQKMKNILSLGLRWCYADMAELADAPDLGSGVFDVQVQVLLSAVKNPRKSGVFLLSCCISCCIFFMKKEIAKVFVYHHIRCVTLFCEGVLVSVFHNRKIRPPATLHCVFVWHIERKHDRSTVMTQGMETEVW